MTLVAILSLLDKYVKLCYNVFLTTKGNKNDYR